MFAGRLVVAAELVRQAGVRVGAHEHRRDPGELLHVGPERLGTEGAVEPDARAGGACATEFQKASVVWPESVRPLASVMVPEIMTGTR